MKTKDQTTSLSEKTSPSLKKTLKLSCVLLLCSVGVLLLCSVAIPDLFAQAKSEDPMVGQPGTGAEGVLSSPEYTTPVYSETMPEISAAQRSSFDEMDRRRQKGYDALNAALEPNPSHPIEPPMQFPFSTESQLDETDADSTFYFFRSHDVSVGSQSAINEPAHAQLGKYVFYTGNWYAAKSTNAGSSFTYTSPYSDFPDFCCDQDVIHNAPRNVIIWYRQGVADGKGTNRIKLSVSINGGVNFWTYTWTPTTFDASLTNRWFDYPHLAVSNDYLYLTSNVFNASDNQTNRIVIRLALEQLAAAQAVPYYRWTFGPGATITPVSGTTDVMYFGSAESSAGTFRVYSWPESTTTLSSVARTIPAYTFTSRNGVCTTPNESNPCGRADGRVLDGWVAKGTIGFYWNVKQGGAFSYPYINAATFRESDKVYLARPYIWNSGFAFQYGAIAPNIRGDLGAAALLAGGTIGYPKFAVSLDDDFNAPAPPWSFSTVASSSNWDRDGAGDYLRVRQFSPLGSFWTASGYYGSGSPVSYKGRFVAFGRGRELRAWNRWSLY